ncbi:hypothetical protein BDZ89DRAFT_1056851 [Hymenopellis radicata]|nr:hypothetical protein BDZ89DRAFT_1056851 [Hymenopellis radicata]
MHFQAPFAAFLVLLSAVSTYATPAMEQSAAREMRSALEKKENCYCYNKGDPKVTCQFYSNAGSAGYCPGGKAQFVCCDDCRSSHGCFTLG